MANFTIPEDPDLNLQLRKLETTDRGHADVFNSLFGVLITNDAFLNALANKMIEKAMISHNLDSSNKAQVMGADTGPKITQLINTVDQKVTELSSDIPKIQSGKAIFYNIPNDTVRSLTITFDTPFKVAPMVFGARNFGASDPINLHFDFSQITTTGFKIALRHTLQGTGEKLIVPWMAIEVGEYNPI